MGAWVSYGIGSETEDLPAFVVMISPGSGTGGQPLYDRLWGSGFLPSQYQGVKFRSVGDPVLYLSNPHGFDAGDRRAFLDSLAKLNRIGLDEFGDPEISTRIAQYEMAFRMQTSVPELTDLSKEPQARLRSLRSGRPEARHLRRQLPAGAAAGRARRAFHPALSPRLGPSRQSARRICPKRCKETDQAAAALITDLKQRGMLDDTLVIWGGEFGRTVYCQGRLTPTTMAATTIRAASRCGWRAAE